MSNIFCRTRIASGGTADDDNSNVNADGLYLYSVYARARVRFDGRPIVVSSFIYNNVAHYSNTSRPRNYIYSNERGRYYGIRVTL